MNTLLKIQTFINLLFKTLGSSIKVIIMSDYSTVGKYPIKTENSELFILGNGPSLISDLDRFNDKVGVNDLMAVNYFADTDIYTELKPKFYCIAAPEMLIDNPAQSTIDLSNKLFKNIAEKTDWELTLLLISKAKKSNRWKDIILKNSKIKVVYFNTTPIEGLKFANYFGWKNNLGLPRPHNVLIPSLIIGINLNYREINILGADHSWLSEISVDKDNNALINQKHFYDNDKTTSKPMRKGLYNEKRKLHEILHKFYLAFQGYHEINKYAEKNNTKIYNLTPNSFIDAFERK